MSSPSLKRKLTDRDDMLPTQTKKQRPSVPSVTITLKPTKHKPFASAPIPMPNACPDYPNGFIYCHQCSKKRDVTDAIQCTFLETHHSSAKDKDKGKETDKETDKVKDKDKDKDGGKDTGKVKDKDKEKPTEKPPRQRRCVGKFCKFCLKNRYDLDFDDVVNVARSKKKEPGHIDTASYIYKCPKCCDTCNCPRCRKSKGLEPMGSAGTIRKPPPEPVPKPSAAERNKANRKSKQQKDISDSASTAGAAKGKGATKKPKPKPLPIAKWTPVPVGLSLEDAEARFNIREFVLRFADLMEPTLPKTNLEELEEIGGGRHQGRDEDEEMVSWVSEFCVKSIIVGILNLIAKELHGALANAIKSAVKEIRNLGVNLNKIWPVLASLRDISLLTTDDYAQNLPPSTLPGSSPRRPFTFTFPDPLPPPTTHDIRNIRSTRLNDTNDGPHIAYSAQMVPVITALIEDALLTGAVREEIEVGVRESREAVRDQREAVKREAERWEQVRKTMETRVKVKAQILENRAKREYHKQKLISLENSLKVLMPKFSPRLAPVGFDTEDRVYWIISPGVSEREAAQDFIFSCASDEKLLQAKKSSRRSVVKKVKVLGSEEERAEMRSWSWFVVVWGKKPADAAGSPKAITSPVRGGNEKREVKLKIKVNPQVNVNTGVKAKKSVNEEDMDVDDEMGLQVQDERDEDEEMASASDQDDRARNWDSPTSSSHSDSDGEESDNDARTVSDESDSGSDEEEQSEEEEEEKEEKEKEDDDRDRWWGFYDPLEILKLSNWIAFKAGLDEDSNDPTSTAPLPSRQDERSSRASSSTVTPNGIATPTGNGSVNGYTNGTGQKSRDTSVTVVANPSPPTRLPLSGGKAQLKNLVDELRTFATLLEWRCREDKYELILRDLSAAAGGSSVSTNGSASGDSVAKGQTRDRERERESTDGRSISVSSFYGSR